MRLILSILALCIFIQPVMAEHHEGDKEPGVYVKKAYSFATAASQKNGAVFMKIKNYTESDDRLIGAAVPSGMVSRTEIHEMNMDGDMMMMRKIDGLDIPAGETVMLEPTGFHVMLIGLTSQLVEGESFPLTLSFEQAGEKIVDVAITAPGEIVDHKHDHHEDEDDDGY